MLTDVVLCFRFCPSVHEDDDDDLLADLRYGAIPRLMSWLKACGLMSRIVSA